MSQKRVIFILLASATIGLLAVLAALRFIGTAPSPSVSPPKPSHHMVVATADLKPDAPIAASDLSLAPWHAATTPAGASVSTDPLVGKKPIRLIKKGEVVLDTQLRAAGDPPPLSDTIRPGYRAVSIQVNEASDVGGFVMPGSFVDVLMRAQDEGGATFSRVIVQRVPVLAIGGDRTVNDPAKPKPSSLVTLEVTLQEAEQIEMARGIGVLTLLLRNAGDRNKDSSPGANAQTLQPVMPTVEIIRGTERSLEARE